MHHPSLPAFGFIICFVTTMLFSGPARTLNAGPISSPQASLERTARYSADQQSEVLRQAGRHLASITARTMPSVVNIESTHSSKSGKVEETGSGVIMKSPRSTGLFVITNRHVVSDASLNQIDVHLHDGRVLTPTEKLEDPDSDLAILRIPDVGVQAAQFGDSDNLDIGHFVLAMGSPFGLKESVTLGIISAKGRRSLELPGRNVVNQDFLQTDAAINPGNSGGPLIDLDGRVIGINTAIASQGGGNEGIGFSIPSNLVQFIVGQLLDYGHVRRGYLGVELDEHFNFEVARRYGLDRKLGTRVTRVMDRTPAAQAGIRADDIIINFDGFDVADERDLINKVSVTPVNKQVRIVVLRNGKQIALTVVLAEKPERNTSEQAPPPAVGTPVIRQSSFSAFKLTSSLAIQSGYHRQQKGLLVTRTVQSEDENSLQVYDVIEEVARCPVTTQAELESALSRIPAGEDVLLKVRRIIDGEPQSLLVLYKRDASSPETTVRSRNFAESY